MSCSPPMTNTILVRYMYLNSRYNRRHPMTASKGNVIASGSRPSHPVRIVSTTISSKRGWSLKTGSTKPFHYRLSALRLDVFVWFGIFLPSLSAVAYLCLMFLFFTFAQFDFTVSVEVDTSCFVFLRLLLLFLPLFLDYFQKGFVPVL